MSLPSVRPETDIEVSRSPSAAASMLKVIRPCTAVLRAPTIIRLFRNLELANSVNTNLILPYHHITSQSFVTISNGLWRFLSISDPTFSIIKINDQSSGEGSRGSDGSVQKTKQ